MEKKYPIGGYEDLFDYLSHNHGLNLLQSEMTDLIDIVHKFHPAHPPSDAEIYNENLALKGVVKEMTKTILELENKIKQLEDK